MHHAKKKIPKIVKQCSSARLKSRRARKQEHAIAHQISQLENPVAKKMILGHIW